MHEARRGNKPLCRRDEQGGGVRVEGNKHLLYLLRYLVVLKTERSFISYPESNVPTLKQLGSYLHSVCVCVGGGDMDITVNGVQLIYVEKKV